MRSNESRWRGVVLACGLGLFSGALFVGACDDDGSGGGEVVATVATYNAGLAYGYVDYALQRREALVDYVKDLDADVVCLQEVWEKDDIDAFVNGAKATFPHAYYEHLVDTTLGPPSCPLANTDVTDLKACAEEKCGTVEPQNLAGCVLAVDNCKAQFDAVGGACQGCLAANIGADIEGFFSSCTAGSALFAYGGANGLVLLSKSPLSHTVHRKLPSSINQRSFLFATTELGDLGTADIACTHLAANHDGTLIYTGPFDSFIAEQKAQAELMRDYIDDNGTSSIAFVAGDFNSGPDIGATIKARNLEASYTVMTQAGYTSPGVEADAPECSFCSGNLLVSDSHDDQLIDHVFVSGLPSGATTKATRFGVEPLTIDDNGTSIQTSISDHYGVSVQVLK